MGSNHNSSNSNNTMHSGTQVSNMQLRSNSAEALENGLKMSQILSLVNYKVETAPQFDYKEVSYFYI
jgi:hypothetical protein